MKITTYFITKDEKLCKSFLWCTLFLLFSFDYFWRCLSCSIREPLSYLVLLSRRSLFSPSIHICKTFYESEREQGAEKVEKVVRVVKSDPKKECWKGARVGQACGPRAQNRSDEALFLFSPVFTSMLCWISYAVKRFCYVAYFSVFNKCSLSSSRTVFRLTKTNTWKH